MNSLFRIIFCHDIFRYYLNGGDAFRLKLWIDKRDALTQPL